MVDLVEYSSNDKITSAWANLVKDYIQDGTHKINTLSVDVGGTEVIDSDRNIDVVTAGVVQTSVTGNALSVSRDLASASTDSPVVSIVQDNAGDDQHVLYIKQDGTDSCVKIVQEGEATALEIDHNSTGAAVQWNVEAGKVNGHLGHVYSATASFWFMRDVTSTDSAGPVCFIEQDNSGDDQNALNIQQDGTGNCLYINQDGDGIALNINSEATSNTNYAFESKTSEGNRNSHIYQQGNNIGLYIEKGGVGTGIGLYLQNDGTDNGLLIDQNGNGRSLYIDSESTTVNVVKIEAINTDGNIFDLIHDGVHEDTANKVFKIREANSYCLIDVLYVENDGTGNGLVIDQNGNGVALNIDSEATSKRSISVTAQNTSSQTVFFQNEAIAEGSVLYVVQEHASSTGPAMSIRNNGTSYGLNIDQNGDGTALYIDSECANDTDIINVEPAGTSPGAFKVTRNDDVTGNVVMRLGNNYLWVDSTGDLRIDGDYPTSDTDGTVVGTQS